jgi:hypothetical protein
VFATSLRMKLPMTNTTTVSPLRQRMLEDMASRMLANGQRTDSLAKARELLAVPAPVAEPEPGQHESDTKQVHPRACPCCGSRMLVIEVFARGSEPSWRSAGAPRPTSVVSRIDTS